VVQLVDPATTPSSLLVNTSSQQGAKISGIELAYEQPIGAGLRLHDQRQPRQDQGGRRPSDGRRVRVGGQPRRLLRERHLQRKPGGNYRGKYVSSSTAPAPTANSQGLSVINGVTMPVAPTMARA
jgi:iron complex outermembrane receptor protein